MSFPNFSALAVRERAVTLFFLILAALAGIYAFISLGRAEDPAFTVRAMVVSVAWPGATPETLQEQVVNRLEKRIQEVENLYRIETTVRPGQANLQVEFHDYTPQGKVPALLYEVRKRMQDEARNLPAGVLGPFINDDFSDVYFTLLALSAPGMPMRELTREAESMRDRLQRLPGVQKVMLLGERTERLYIEFDRAKMANLGIAPQTVFDAINANNRLLPAGNIETAGPRLYLRVDADLSDPGQLAALPIRVEGRLIHLGDFAQIRRGYEDPPTYLVRSRAQDAILLGVVMNRGGNGLDLGERVAGFLEREKQTLPLGMSLDVLTNQAEAIAGAVSLFQIKFMVAVAVVVAVSVLAIGLRAGLIIGIAVPITLGISFLIMKLMGVNLDRITLGALIIALGLLVDDAIISVEMMLVKIEEGWERTRAAAHAWTVTAAPMLFGTLVTVSGFLPIGLAQSAVGEYAGNVFWVLGITLIVSWAVAVIFAPYLGVKMLRDLPASQIHSHADVYQTANYVRLRRIITWCVRCRKRVIVTTLGLLLLAIMGMALFVQKQFFPSSDRPEVLVSVYLPQGSSIGATDRTVKKLEAILAPLSEVRSLSSYIGAGAPRFFISANPEPPDPAFAKIIAVTTDATARDKVIEMLKSHVDHGEFPEARVRVFRLLYGPPVIWPVAFRIIGPDADVLRDIAGQVQTVMAANPHIVDPHPEWMERTPTLHFSIDPARLRLLDLTPQEVAQQLQTQLNGITVAQARQDIRSVDIVARGAGELDAERLAALEILNLKGRKIPLSQLGKLEIRFETPVIKRYNREPFLALQADVAGAQAN